MTDFALPAPATRGLRASLFSSPLGQRMTTLRVSKLAFAFAALAVVAEFCISGNTLTLLGFSYSDLGGSPFVKFLPATYLAIMGALTAVAAGSAQNTGLSYLFSTAPALLLFNALIVFCMVFSAYNVGLTGAGVYIDTYLSAGALAVIMATADDRQRTVMARLVLFLCLANVLISLAEYVHQEHFIPLSFTNEEGKTLTDDQSDEFRPAALYSHSLTGAMATAFGVFLVLERNLSFVRTGGYFVLLLVGLLGFGGRAALVVTVVLLALRVVFTVARDMMQGRVNARLLGSVVLAVSVMGPLMAFLLVATPVGQRIAARSYYDDSAEVRANQWLVLDKLSPHQAMYGVPAGELNKVYEQAGLVGIENPLILVFLNLGIVGTPFFMCGLVAFFLYLWRAYPDSGWLLVASALILSGSNSIGVKGPDLFLMTACAVSMRGNTRLKPLNVLRVLQPRKILAHLSPKSLRPEPQVQKAGVSIARPHQNLSSRVTRLSN